MLKDLLKARATSKHVVLLSRLDEYLLLKKDDSDRAKGVLHPSEISGDFCPRYYVMTQLHPEMRKVKPSLQRTFDVGHATHEMMQRYYGDMGVLYGTYKDRHNDTYYGFKPREIPTTYDEVHIRNDELNIEGHTDGVIVIERLKYIWEFKTINTNGFKSLIEPIEKHKQQAYIYLYCEEIKRHKRLQWFTQMNGSGLYTLNIDVESMPFAGVIIQYIDKDTQEIKEYMLPNNSKVAEYIEKMRPLWEIANEGLKAGKLPEYRCGNPKCKACN